MNTEAMKLALDDLISEFSMENSSFAKRVDDIFKEALVEQPAQQQQEPVAWLTQARCLVGASEFTEAEAELYGWKPLYTSPQPARLKTLTDDEKFKVADVSDCFEDVVDATEAKLKEKNT